MQPAPWYFHVISGGGLLAVCLLAWLSGGASRKVRLGPLCFGLFLQLVVGAAVFLLPIGREFLWAVNQGVVGLLEHARAGISFLFGPLAIPPGVKGSLGFILAVQALPTVIFFMALTFLLYQAGVMQRLVGLFARLFVRTLGTSGAESLGVASNIFVGIESAGMVRPFLETMTKSEFFCLLTACMATVSSTVLGIYVATLKPIFPGIAGHLVSASVISAPAAIVVAKLMMPETGQPLTAGQAVDPGLGRYGGYMEAVTKGSMEGMRQLVGIVAMLISFLGLVSLANGMLGWMGGWVGLPSLSLQGILGRVAWPITVAMGVPPADAGLVARLLGERALLTEVTAYAHLAQAMEAGRLAFARSPMIASYALCGFAHVGSTAIFVGGFGALVPGRLGELSRLGLRALWAATLATVMTGCVAGLFASGGAGLLAAGPN